MHANSNPKRIGLLKIEALKTLRSFNKPVNPEIVEEKADLWEESLISLKTDKIEEFFIFIRENRTMPSDGTIKSILGVNLGRFSYVDLEDSRYGSYNETGVYVRRGTFYTWSTLPLIHWTENMKKLLKKFHLKNMTSEEAEEWDILQETRWDAITRERIL